MCVVFFPLPCCVANILVVCLSLLLAVHVFILISFLSWRAQEQLEALVPRGAPSNLVDAPTGEVDAATELKSLLQQVRAAFSLLCVVGGNRCGVS
jgi:hypothetical protein